MTLAPTRALLAPGMSLARARALPWLSVAAGSLVTALPVVASVPLLPPAGLLMLLAWRLLAPLSLKVWAPALLGLFDDLVSGQPLGSAMLLWQLASLGIGLVDSRTVFRSFAQDWAVAAGALLFCLVVGRLVASPLTAHVDLAVLVQVALSALLFPLAARVVAWIDAKRRAAA